MRALVLLSLCTGLLSGQNTSPAVTDKIVKEARHRFLLVASRATALFASADTIENSLRADGSTLHPQTAALRLRIKSALEGADAAIAERDLELARTETTLAEELVTRLARRIGGD